MRLTRALFIGCSLVLLAACEPLPPAADTPAPEPVAQEPSAAFEGDDLPAVTTGTGTIVLERLLPGGVLEQGSPDAPVTLLVVTHPSCGYCRALQRQLLPGTVMPYVAQGMVRIHTMFLPLKKYPQSALQAGLLLCAAKQGKGGAMLNWLMEQDTADKAKTLKMAGMPATDIKALSICLDDPAMAKIMDVQTSLADTLGVRLVPTLIMNGTANTGLPSAADLEGWVKESIAAQRLQQ